jgi:hypothetical protein
MTVSTVSSLSNFPNYFWQSLEKSNQDKDAEAPVAVAIYAQEDHNKAFTRHGYQFLILQVAKIYRMIVCEVRSNRGIGLIIQNAAEQRGKAPQLLLLSAHGREDCIYLNRKNLYTLSDVREEDFSNLAPNAEIFLNSCLTGSQSCKECLAQRIANVSKRTVFAPAFNIFGRNTCIIPLPERKIQIFSYTESNIQHIYQFNSEKTPQLDLFRN